MKLAIFKGADAIKDASPYVMSVSMTEEVVPPHNTFHVPVYKTGSDAASIYSVEICGFRLEADMPEALIPPSRRLLDGLINSARLPTYVFAASDSLLVYPVYTIGDEVFATTPGGPIFRHVELAKVRSYLSEYLHTMKELGTVNHAETLHVRGIDKNTLGLIRPAFYLKKRVPGEVDFWAPVFRSEDGRTIYTYAASAKREAPVDNGYEILELHGIVAEALREQGRLNDPHDLRPDRLYPARLTPLRSTLVSQPYQLSFHSPGDQAPTSLPLYRNGKAYVVIEHRRSEDRYNLYLGHDPRDLCDRVSSDFVRRGKAAAVTLAET